MIRLFVACFVSYINRAPRASASFRNLNLAEDVEAYPGPVLAFRLRFGGLSRQRRDRLEGNFGK